MGDTRPRSLADLAGVPDHYVGRLVALGILPDPGEVDISEGFFDYFGNPMACVALLRNESSDGKARAIFNQLLSEMRHAKHLAWLPPMVA